MNAITLRYSVEKMRIGGNEVSYWQVYDHVGQRMVANWLSHGAAMALAAELSGDEPEDEPAFDADDRAASDADRAHQMRMEG